MTASRMYNAVKAKPRRGAQAPISLKSEDPPVAVLACRAFINPVQRVIEEVPMRQVCLRALLLCVVMLAGLAFAAQAAEKAPQEGLLKEGLLLAAFGTSVPEALPAFKAVDRSFRQAFPGCPVVWAYTSQIIRRKLAREGRPVGGIRDGLARLAADGVKVARVQPLHVMPGEEFTALERAVLIDLQKHPGRFEAVYLGRPLLESRRDALEVAQAVLEDMGGKRRKHEALVLMGHGQAQGRADLVFEGTRALFKESDPLVFMATVEGARGFEDLLAELKQHKVKKVWLQPLMLTAGEHARNDLGGKGKESWASRLKAEGFQVESELKGLGEVAGVRTVYVRHAGENADDLTREPRKQ